MKTSITLSILAVIFIISGAFAQTEWDYVSQPGENLIITSETTGYTYINEEYGNNGFRYYLKKSTDGLQTFTTIKEDSGTQGCCGMVEMFFINSDIGFVANGGADGYSIEKTTNGGQDWTATGYGGYWNMSMCFLNENLGYYASAPSLDADSYLYQNETMVYSTAKYYLVNDYSEATNFITKIKFLNDSTGFIICKDTSNNAVILKTTNFGYNWSEMISLNNNLFTDLKFVSDSIGFVIGYNGVVLKTTDLGEQWQIINTNINTNLNSVDFAPDNIGYIVGDNGVILKSIDLGETWTLQDFSNSDDLVYVKLFTQERAYINTSEGKLYSNHNTLVSENYQEQIKIYPNPASDKLTISLPDYIITHTVVLYDMNGKKVLKSTDNEININYLAKGLYVLEIKTGTEILWEKIIKK